MKKKLSDDGFERFEFIEPKKPYKLRLNELRKKANLNQTQAGQIVFTSQRQYSRWETDEFPIPIFELCLFSIFFNCSTDYILGLTNNEAPLYTAEERQKIIDSLKISRYFNRYGLWSAPSGEEVMKKFHNFKRSE